MFARSLLALTYVEQVNWPEEIAKSDICSSVRSEENNFPLFHGPRVRMGVHSAFITPVFDARSAKYNYAGSGVNVAESVSDAGHGGQVIVSGTSVELLRLPELR